VTAMVATSWDQSAVTDDSLQENNASTLFDAIITFVKEYFHRL